MIVGIAKMLSKKSDWRFDTSDGVMASVDFLSGGTGNFYLKWRQEDKQYRLRYVAAGVGLGFSLPVGLAFSSKDAPGSGIGNVYLLPPSDSVVLADFKGPFMMISGRANAGAGFSGALVFLGTTTATAWVLRLAFRNPLTASALPGLAFLFKSCGILWGGLAGSTGATIDVITGEITSAT
jgi:hypothetical protein